MEQKENSEIIVIKSDKEWIQEIKADTTSHVIGSVGIIAMISFFMLYPSQVPKWEIELLSSPLIIVTILFILDIYRIWRNIGRELVLDKTGILIKLWFKEKKYGWNDFKFRQVRKNIGEYCYDEGLFLTKHKHQPRQNSNCELFSIRYPSGSVVINFKMHRPILANQKTQQYINAEIMAVEKEELLSKLKEWGVDFETERPKNWAIFQDKKGRLQSRRNGTAWILLAAAVWILLLGFIIYPIFIWKNPVLIAIFIPFFIALVPVYVVVTSRKSYRLKMDEKGCIRKFLFLSKRYLWKDLRVKLVASEESHCGEGVLFIKKKSGNSSSASETFSYASLHPYSSFVANFEVFGKMYGEKDALHEINKELFLKKMKEWGVEVEGLPKEE